MAKSYPTILRFGLALTLITLFLSGCSGWKSVKEWAGYPTQDVEEEMVPPEAQQETVMIDGKPYIRSKNPYWLTYPDQPEYIYVEKGREFVPMQRRFIEAIAKAVGKEKDKTGGKAIPPDKLQEMVKAEVDRILREQGLGGFVSKAKAEKAPVVGRAVAVIPDVKETPGSMETMNRTLASSLAEALRRQKDISVIGSDQVGPALAKAQLAGKLTSRSNIQALGDRLGVQGLVITKLIPPQGNNPGFLVLEIFDTFQGNKTQSIVEPEPAGLKPDAVTKFAQQNALRVAGELVNMDWFGRVDFVKEGKVYLNLGQNAGLKVGDRLKVVTPGKEVVNPSSQAVLGYTSDTQVGELKVTELLGNTGAVALATSGGPFKAGEKVKAK
ncbi:MAG: hypothetical protein C4567_06850 [Deltaproteobacteria bacterium]|nr:MAG: hypothetical protein C4567_06850 [Deltaproteobacteria bacterium]